MTDHDTTAATAEVSAACEAAGIEFVPGIEITAAVEGADVHVLGYFIKSESASLLAVLTAQRERRAERVREMIDRLASCGLVLDADRVLAPAIQDSTKSPGRPWIARALVEAGQAESIAVAFERWLARGRPAYVPSVGAPPAAVFRHIHEARGIASLAHPALVQHDEWLPGFVAAGLDAVEAYHPKHDPEATTRYLALAAELKLGVSGGSDFHGPAVGAVTSPAFVSLPRSAFDDLQARVSARYGG